MTTIICRQPHWQKELEPIRAKTATTHADTICYAALSDADPKHVVREIRAALAPFEGGWSTQEMLHFIFARESIYRQSRGEADQPHAISHEILSLRAQLRHALAALTAQEDYAEREALSDIGFALIDASERLTALDDRIEEAMPAAKGTETGA